MTAFERALKREPATNLSGTDCRAATKADRSVVSKVVSTLDERQMVIAVRAAVFLGKPGWDYNHTFDPNDHTATHLLTFANREPAATLRVRWFERFARIERVAVLPEFRSLAVLNSLVRSALRLCRKKGYDHVGGLAYPELVKFWSRHGGKVSGEVIHNELGPLVPMTMTLKHWDDIEPLRPVDAGNRDFELRVFAWEGADV